MQLAYAHGFHGNVTAKSRFYRHVTHFFFPIEPSTRSSLSLPLDREQYLVSAINEAKTSDCFLQKLFRCLLFLQFHRLFIYLNERPAGRTFLFSYIFLKCYDDISSYVTMGHPWPTRVSRCITMSIGAWNVADSRTKCTQRKRDGFFFSKNINISLVAQNNVEKHLTYKYRK